MSLAGIADSVLGSAGEPQQLIDDDVDDVLHLLQTQRRREVIPEVFKADEPVSLRNLSRQVAAREVGGKPESLSNAEYKRVYVPLYQDHLPKLDRAGVVDFDDDRNVIRRGPAIDGYQTLLAWVQPRVGGGGP